MNAKWKHSESMNVPVGHCNSIFHIFLSHWPSRSFYHENSSTRHYLGLRLRDSIDEIIEKEKSNPHIILIGDFNDEPFNKSLSEHLMATRDKNLVRKHKHLLYNPSWNYLGYKNFESDQICGTYYYKSGRITKWHTFDQIIFSHAFINSQEWKLKESNYNILAITDIVDSIMNSKQIFDHLPVIAEIEKVI